MKSNSSNNFVLKRNRYNKKLNSEENLSFKSSMNNSYLE